MAGEGRGARRGAAARLLRLCVNEASALSSRTRRASTCERHNACVQVVMEGFLSWRISPTLRRLVTRLITLVPVLAVCLSLGDAGINALLILSQVSSAGGYASLRPCACS